MRKFLVLSTIFFVIGFFAVHEIYAGSEKKPAQSQSSSVSKKAGGVSTLSGKVVETMNSGGYTYVLLERGGNKTWVAFPKAKVVKGQTIHLRPGIEMGQFESKTLNRKFDKIIFSAGLASPEPSGAMKSPGSKGSVVAPMKKIEVGKAKGADAYTIAEIYKKLGSLDKHKVVVRGKVVKVSSGIMRRNWIHLQDGSGSAAQGNYELVVTSRDLPKRGEVVTVSGTLHKDKDFGMGYKYKAIIENASIKKQ
ncbi:MAG: hypothetical protein P8013_00050 [Candidatus Sulfobium sp.]|jgi:hypothetical protein